MRENSRREFVKVLGGSTVAVTVSLAGCSNGDDGSGDDGGSDSGSDTDGSDGDSQEFQTITETGVPIPKTKLENWYKTERTDLYAETMSETGYELEIETTFEDLPLFLGGNAQIAESMGALEAAEIGIERDEQFAAHAKTGGQHTALYVKIGSKWDPDKTGSVEATIDKLVEEGGTFAIGGWGLGTIPAYSLIFQEKYGYDFSEGGDFNVVTSALPSLAQLVAEEKAAVGTSAPSYGSYGYTAGADDPVLKPIFWMQSEMEDTGINSGTLQLGNAITRKSFSDENIEAMKAYVAASKQAVEWIQNNIDTIVEDQEMREILGYGSKEATRYILEWRYLAEHSENTVPPSNGDLALTDEYIQAEKETIAKAQSLGAVKSGWEDYIEFKNVDISAYL
jgi:hypothetical protein